MKKLFLFIFLLFVISACSGREDYAMMDSPANANFSTDATAISRLMILEEEADWYGSDTSTSTADNVTHDDIAGQNQRHIIQDANVEMETEEFQEVVDKLRLLVNDEEIGGYIENESLSMQWGKLYTVVMRVPAAQFENVLSQVQTFASVRFINQYAQDVTDRFYDLRSNLETRQIEEERILALIEEATNIQEIIALETRLSNTRQAIESYNSQLNRMAGQIAFSTITVTVRDISEEVLLSPTLGERIGGAFGNSVDITSLVIQEIIIFFAGVIVPLAILGLFSFIVYKTTKFFKRKEGTINQ